MTQDDKFYRWKKGDKSFINQYFNCYHFECRCRNNSCIDQQISIELIEKLTQLWEKVGKLDITSGFRCSKYQEELRKRGVNTVVAQKSSHEEGIAADVRSPDRIQIEIRKEIEALFNNIGYSTGFHHVDMRPLRSDGTKRKWNY